MMGGGVVNHLVIGAYVPLYFIAAWAMSDRNVACALKYRIPLRMRAQSSSIRYYWLIDLAFAGLAFPFVYFAAQSADAFQGTINQGAIDIGTLTYAVVFIIMGLLWPELSGVQITTKAGMELSIAKLRDRFLGAARLETINDHLTSEMEAWVDRVADSVRASPEAFEVYIRNRLQLKWADYKRPSDDDLDQFRAELLRQAAKDFEPLYESVCQVANIPFVDRYKPLMKIPGMTFLEEQMFYDAGITTIGRLSAATAGPVGSIPPDRVMRLRISAKQFNSRRRKTAAGSITIVAAALVGLGSISPYVTPQPLPSAGVATQLPAHSGAK